MKFKAKIKKRRWQEYFEFVELEASSLAEAKSIIANSSDGFNEKCEPVYRVMSKGGIDGDLEEEELIWVKEAK